MKLTLSLVAHALVLAACLSRSHCSLFSSPKESQVQFPSVAGASESITGAADDTAKLSGWDSPYVDPVLADPISKDPLLVTVRKRGKARYRLSSKDGDRCYSGSSNTYIDLLNPISNGSKLTSTDSSNSGDKIKRRSLRARFLRRFPLFVHPSSRHVIDDDYIPMRDLFTSPSISSWYERGWRQNFEKLGFPGPDREAELAMEYFDPAMTSSNSKKVLVDMSCASGLFTRRFAHEKKYSRVIGCDYSKSMLQEARRRIKREWKKPPASLGLVQLDVGQLPMQSNSVDALHAGAAMHCWPDLPAAMSEVHRVLRPGGRYFATTFMSSIFGDLPSLQGDLDPTKKAFQYFDSTNDLLNLVVAGGFKRRNVSIEVLGKGCAVIRAEK
jgi:SAM-dependent methyltransferase